jgi:protein gp37
VRMTPTKIDVDRKLAEHWGGRKALNWTVIVGCTETARKRESICAVNRLSACWAENISGHGFDQIKFLPGNLNDPLKRAKSAVVLVSWRSEIADAPQEVIDKILDVICQCPQHAFLGLTKKPKFLASKFAKWIASYGYQFPQNLLTGVTVNLQSELHRVRELEQYLKYYGAFLVFVEPCLGRHETRAWLEALQNSPSVQLLALGGWSTLTPDWVKEHHPISVDSIRAIVGATYELQLTDAEHRHVAVAYKDNCPLGEAEGYKSDFPKIPEWLKAYGMFDGEDEETPQPASPESAKDGSQASLF